MGIHYDQPAERHVVCRRRHRPCAPRLGTSKRRRGRFTKQYGLRRLVHAERYEDILAAKQRERNIKHWPRAWKIQLILRDNPKWDDLYDELV